MSSHFSFALFGGVPRLIRGSNEKAGAQQNTLNKQCGGFLCAYYTKTSQIASFLKGNE